MTLLTHWDGEPLDVWARLWSAPRVEAHSALPSTNDRARAWAERGEPPFSVVLADRQTAGRGRKGSTWHSPAGSGLWVSVLLPESDPPTPFLPLLVGLAVARAVESQAPSLAVRVKWPNDLEVSGRKLGGVLCEHGRGPVVAGVGLNVHQRPGDFPRALQGRATSVEAACGERVSLGGIATHLMAELRCLCTAPGRVLSGQALADLASRDALRGRRVLTESAGPGVAKGLAPDGALLLQCGGGRNVRVISGSVRAARGEAAGSGIGPEPQERA